MRTEIALPEARKPISWIDRSRPRLRRQRTEPLARMDQPLQSAMAIVVHDLRGPLANLQIMIELMEAYSQRQAGGEIPACANRALDLITSLDEMLTGVLERVRLTGDPLAFRPGLVDLGSVVDQAMTLSRPLAEASGITLVRTGTGPLVVEGDRQLLVEALDNLLGNAVKHAPAGSTVECGFAREGGAAILSVGDRGSGFTPTELAALFRPFTRLTRKGRPKERSVGLGLWITRLIATRHGGQVTAANRADGPGSILTLRLPAGPGARR